MENNFCVKKGKTEIFVYLIMYISINRMGGQYLTRTESDHLKQISDPRRTGTQKPPHAMGWREQKWKLSIKRRRIEKRKFSFTKRSRG